MMKKMLLPLLLAASIVAQAKPVDTRTLMQVAAAFHGNGASLHVQMHRLGNEMALVGWDDGFVLLAADDCVRPVLAFSADSPFNLDDMPAHVAAWLDGYRREIASCVAAGVGQSPQVAAEWDYWLHAADAKSVGDSLAPLLTTAWNQGYGYNSLCPYDANDSMRCYTGCVATATAQIMNYWKHPAVGWGSYSYVHSLYGRQTANFGATSYQWSLMPDTVNALTSDSAIQAVAELMYHVGVAVAMQYGTSGSGAYVNSYGNATLPSSENALKTYFKYSPMLYGVFKSEYSDAAWDTLLRGELDGGRPVLYSGHDTTGGHAFVLDGYSERGDSLSSRLFFHVNWGWGGYCDGFYTTDSLSPGTGGAGGNSTYTFNLANSAVVGIAPAAAVSDTIVTVSVAPDNYTHGTVSGSGEYHPYTDNVTLWAHAAEGYRFVRWQSGSTQNPVNFLAFGDVVDTAIFERIVGDTIGYCHDGLVTAWADDYGSTTEWGIRVPPVVRGAGRAIRAVQLYPYEHGIHTVSIYIGNDLASASMVYTMNVNVGDAEYMSWCEFALDSALRVSGTDVVWVTVSHTGSGYPAAASRYSGNSDGTWYHLPGGWVCFDQEDIFYGSWMLRAVFEPRVINIDVAPADPNICTTYGEGTYRGGDQVVIGAIIFDPNCTFTRWSDGSPYNPYTFTASDDTLMVAHCTCAGVGIDEADAETLSVAVDGRTVSVSADAAFFDMQGRLLARGRTATMPASGVYVVKAAGTVRKVVVL